MTDTTNPVFTFKEARTQRHYQVGNASAVRESHKKFPIAPDTLVIHLRDGLVEDVTVTGPSILRSGEFGKRHDFAFSNSHHFLDDAPDWINELIAAERLQWKASKP